jgi:hypothetical protein
MAAAWSWSVWSKRLGKRLSSGQKAFLKFGMPMLVSSPFIFNYILSIFRFGFAHCFGPLALVNAMHASLNKCTSV